MTGCRKVHVRLQRRLCEEADPLEVGQFVFTDIPQNLDGALLHVPPHGLVHLRLTVPHLRQTWESL